jgi:hypothetical protein
MLDNDEIKWLVLDMLKDPSERDRQTLIGPSEIGNSCDYCVARRLMESKGHPRKDVGQYWLGARIGTAIHEALQIEGEKHAQSGKGRFKALRGAVLEKRFPLTVIEGYGEINLKPDLVLVNDAVLVDYKTTSKAKLAHYKLDGVPRQYIIQQNLYAFGLRRNGIDIQRIALVFINRDGTQDSDVNVLSFEVDEEIAVKALDRLQKIWDDLTNGKTPDDFESDEDCYYCRRVIGRL